MDKICELIKQAHEIIINDNPTSIIHELENIISNQKIQIEQLILNQDKYLEQINNLKKELDIKTIDLQKKNDEFDNLSKFSIIQNVHKQLDEKNNYIQILESQIDRQKKYHSPPSPKTNIAIQTDIAEISIPPKYNFTVESEIINDIQINEPDLIKEKKKKKKDKYIDEPELIINIDEPEPPINIEEPEPTINIDEPEQVKEKKKKKKDKYIEEPELPINTQEPEQVKEKKKKKKDKHIVEQLEKDYSDNEIFINHNYDKPIKKKKNHDIIEEFKNDFDIDKFEDINGFELLIYKKIYYLRDLETNELYDILNNKQNKKIGLIVNGKVKLN